MHSEVKVKAAQSCLTLWDPVHYTVHGVLQARILEYSWVGCYFLLQGIFPTQGSNPGVAHCRWNLYQLSYRVSPRIPEWVAYPIFRRSSQPRNQTRISCSRKILYQLSYQESPDMQSASCEMQGWIKHKLESRLPGEISTTSVCKWYYSNGKK